MLRNPNMLLHGSTPVYASNVYEITDRDIRLQGSQARITIYISVYVDETKADLIKQIQEEIVVLNNQAELNPDTYETKWIEQHGSKVVDGSLLSSFTSLP